MFTMMPHFQSLVETTKVDLHNKDLKINTSLKDPSSILDLNNNDLQAILNRTTKLASWLTQTHTLIMMESEKSMLLSMMITLFT